MFLGIDPVHLFQNAAGPCLNREVDEFTEGGEIADGFHELSCDVDRVAGHKANSFNAIDFIEAVEKIMKQLLPLGLVLSVAIDILP